MTSTTTIAPSGGPTGNDDDDDDGGKGFFVPYGIIVIVVVVLLIVAIILLVCCCLKKHKKLVKNLLEIFKPDIFKIQTKDVIFVGFFAIHPYLGLWTSLFQNIGAIYFFLTESCEDRLFIDLLFFLY